MKTALSILLVACMVLAASFKTANSHVEFTSHKDGATIYENPVTMGGTLAALPSGGHLWLVAHLKSLNKSWWPQGGGELTLNGGQWTCAVFLGNGQAGIYEVSAVIVNDQENASLNDWVSTAQPRNYPPIRFPNAMDGTSTTTITVTKQ